MKRAVSIKKIQAFLFLFALASLFRPGVNAQDEGKGSYLDFGADFFQVKDEKNYGLVFNGGKVDFSYIWRGTVGNSQINYRGDFGFGPSFSKEIAGINIKINPLNLDYSFQLVNKPSARLFLGPYASMNYQFQLYPELQSGHALWFTFYDLGPRLILETRQWEQDFRISFSTAVVGLVSRPVEMNEEYYYTLNVGDIMQKMHSNFTFGSLDILNHIELEAEWKIPGSRKSNLAYRFEYLQFSPQASLDYMAHVIVYRMKLGTKRNSQ